MLRFSVFFSVFVIAGSLARADILLLEGGGRVEGVVHDQGTKLRVESLHGSVLIPKAKVRDRVKGRYITQVFEDRRARTDSRDSDALFRLHEWCLKNGLRRRAEILLREILEVDPDHARTRKKLGQIRHEGTWMTPRQAEEARLTALGLVLYEGRWMTKAGLSTYLAMKAEFAALEKETARRRSALEEEKRQEKEAAERKARELAEKAERKAVLARAKENEREKERLAEEVEDLKDLVRILLLRDADRRRYGWYGSPFIWVGSSWGGGYGGGGWHNLCPPVAVPFRAAGPRTFTRRR